MGWPHAPFEIPADVAGAWRAIGAEGTAERGAWQERLIASGKADEFDAAVGGKLPADLGDVLGRYDKVLVPEMNMGQLVKLIRAEYLIDAVGLNKIQGRPFKVSEVATRIARMLEG